MHDVYAYGVLAPSTLIELRDAFPSSGGYAEIAAVHPSIGGEAAGSAYVLARLGVGTKLGGTRLGADAASRRVVETLEGAGVDCTSVRLDPATNPVTEIVVAAGEQRTVFATYSKMLRDGSWEGPDPEAARASRIVCLDPFFGAASEELASRCVAAGIPYVTIDTPPGSPIATLAEVLVVSEEFTSRTIEEQDPRRVLAAYTGTCRGLVILTQGGNGGFFGRRGDEPRRFDPFRARVRDTTGAGDSFRAGIIYGMLRGQDDCGLVRTASAVAALVCRSAPGVLAGPTEAELDTFLSDHA
jgi:sugar/nucleoside kinase (ribokinase family)